ncbi:LysM peptidoglycan-binding domain-containing protein [Porphyromonas catoniae]|uniref:LysM domain-containing protein n=1 Tax=Porphyromonas catoniae ATCC 51270 TaxID=887901 RepID=Z4WW43_9PORP|nr:hypothetical protein [Porphyromonas catoniae]EWC93518.1 hypothetical protein HMPREF0636_0964 [Porphyromonas catoniae ATCC 51270]
MLQEELWTVRLAKASSLHPSSSQQLWQALAAQIEQRLLLGAEIAFPCIGVFTLRQEGEFLAQLPDGTRYLVPPRLSLDLRWERAGREESAIPLTFLIEALVNSTKLRAEVIQVWLKAIPILWEELMREAGSVAWPRLGLFHTVSGDASSTSSGYTFTPLSVFAEALNKPFSMFVPVEVAHGEQSNDLEIREVTSLEVLGEIHPITLLMPTPFPETEGETAVEDTKGVEQEKMEAVVVQSSSDPVSQIEPEEEEKVEAPTIQASSDPTPQAELEEEKEVEAPAVQTSPDPISLTESEEEEKVEAPAEATTPVIPPVPSVSVTTPTATSSPRKSRSGCYIWLIVAMLLLIGAILVIFLLNNQQKNKNEAKPLPPKPAQQTTPTTVIPTAEPREKDSLMIQADSSSGTASDALASTPAPAPPSASKAQPASSEETEVVRIQAGDRLTRFSLRKYGHKAFWVYIYEENRSRIKDPDNIPIGTTITLPQASKYKIDARDTNSVNKALILQRSIKNK